MDVVKEDMAEVEVTEEDTEVETTGEEKSAVDIYFIYFVYLVLFTRC